MSLLGERSSTAENKAAREQVYNAGWTYGPAGGITTSEFGDIKEGDYDRETGRKRCAFCRCVKPLKTGNGATCDAYCETNEFSGIPVGRPHPGDADRRGREWLTLG